MVVEPDEQSPSAQSRVCAVIPLGINIAVQQLAVACTTVQALQDSITGVLCIHARMAFVTAPDPGTFVQLSAMPIPAIR